MAGGPPTLEMLGRERRCYKCHGPADVPCQGYCRACRNAYSRSRRKPYSSQSPEELVKSRTRGRSRHALKIGLITWKPCEVCGSEKSEMHHPDYSQHLLVNWLCRDCHLDVHGWGSVEVVKHLRAWLPIEAARQEAIEEARYAKRMANKPQAR